jgi:CarD family transcriptional regulator
MFEVGDFVYHPTNGAGVVANLQKMPTLRKGQRFYKIEMLGKTKTVLMVPVRKAEEIGLRRAVSESEVNDVLGILAAEPENLPKKHKRRYKVCQDKLDTGDTIKIAEVVRDLTWRRIQEDKLNVPGRRIFKKGMQLLAGELAVVQGLELAEAEEQINDVLKQHQKAARES